MVKIIRLDDRLIHGQTINNWCTFYKITEILLINKKVREDFLRRTIIEMSLPSNIKVKFLSVSEALNEDGNKNNNENTLIIFGEVLEVYEYLDGGGEINSLNVGGICYKANREKIKPTVYLDKDEKKILKDIAEAGIEVEFRILPLDKKKPLFS